MIMNPRYIITNPMKDKRKHIDETKAHSRRANNFSLNSLFHFSSSLSLVLP